MRSSGAVFGILCLTAVGVAACGMAGVKTVSEDGSTGGTTGAAGSTMSGSGGNTGTGGAIMQPCMMNANCPTGQVCDEGFCKPPSGSCLAEFDCIDGICKNNVCVREQLGTGGATGAGGTGGDTPPMNGTGGSVGTGGDTGSGGNPGTGGTTTDGTGGTTPPPPMTGSGGNVGTDGGSPDVTVPPPPTGGTCGPGIVACTTNADCTSVQYCLNGCCACDGEPTTDHACKNGKALVCHYPPGNPGNLHEICVGAPAVPAHLDHGDRVGTCPKK